jgi:hypothetical protein
LYKVVDGLYISIVLRENIQIAKNLSQ